MSKRNDIEIPSKVCAACRVAEPVLDFRVYVALDSGSRGTVRVGLCFGCIEFAHQARVIRAGLKYGDTDEKGWRYLCLMRRNMSRRSDRQALPGGEP